jgi:hypothetical protein
MADSASYELCFIRSESSVPVRQPAVPLFDQHECHAALLGGGALGAFAEGFRSSKMCLTELTRATSGRRLGVGASDTHRPFAFDRSNVVES